MVAGEGPRRIRRERSGQVGDHVGWAPLIRPDGAATCATSGTRGSPSRAEVYPRSMATARVDGPVPTPASSDRRWRAIGVVTFVVAGVLLGSFGGAILAAPLTLPLMHEANRRHPSRGFRDASVVIGSLTAGEASWALTYAVLGESGPWIWAVPLCAVAVTAWVFGGGRARRHGPAVAAWPRAS